MSRLDAILDRLRTEKQLAENGGHPILANSFRHAIEEIERLRAALEPFKKAAGFHCIAVQADDKLQVLVKVAPGLSGALTVKDFRRARDTLDGVIEQTPQENP